MLVLTRKIDERIIIGDGVDVAVLSIRGNRVRLGITAPAETVIKRVSADSLSSTDNSVDWEAGMLLPGG